MGQALEARSPTRLGRYELITLIGQGGMAEVHLAMQRGPAGFEKLVVVKLVHQHLASQKAFVDMLLDEGRLAGMIKHPNVVDIYDLGEADGRYFVAMEYLDGEPLLAVLRAGADGKRLDVLSTARVIADTAEGLEAAHRLKALDGKPLGLVHHDVSLGNIVVLYSGVVKLVDFGVAKARTADSHDRIQGKFSYMAPEKLTDGAEVDRRSDIWSLGVVAYEALTLQRLFKGDSDAQTVDQVLHEPIPLPSVVNPDVPVDFDAIVMRALERDPAKRYSTAKAFALDLEEVLRKRGYSGKNVRIVRYMETTFAKQIAARERLLQELSAGKPAIELEETLAAFRESATQTITSTKDHPRARPSESGDLPPVRRSDPSWSVSHKAQSIKGLQAWVEENRAQQRRPLKYMPFVIGGALLLVVIIALAARGGGDDDPVVAASVAPPPAAKTVAKPSGPTPATDVAPGQKSATDPAQASATERAQAAESASATARPQAENASSTEHAQASASATERAPTSEPVTSPSNPTERAPTAEPVTSPSNPTERTEPVTSPSNPTERVPATSPRAPTSAEPPVSFEPDEIEMDPMLATRPARRAEHRPAGPTASAPALYTKGIDEFRRRDYRGALASLTESRRADPSYAPAWYGLGMVHESLTNTGAAKAAYQRYLVLAPNAANARQIRQRIARW